MSAATYPVVTPAVALWAALLVACLPAWAALQRHGRRRRASGLLKGLRGRPGAVPGDVGRGPAWWRRMVEDGRAWIGGRGRGRGRRRRPGRGFLGGWNRRPGGRAEPGGDAGRRAVEAGGVRRRNGGPEWLCLPAGAVLAAITWSVAPMLAGAAAVPLVRGALRGRAERAAAERTAAAVSVLCGTLAGDLRAGRPPHAALADTLQSAGWPDSPELGRIAGLLLSAARFGGDVPGALRTAARRVPGAQGLGAVAACWQVAVDGGAGLAAALDRVAAALRAEADQREDLRAQLAGPRSTAVLLALLPVFGMVLGTTLGAHPATVLLHTPAGLACLVAGAFLEWAGLAWTARIIRAAEGGPSRGAESGPRGSEPGGPVSRPARAARKSAVEGSRS